MITPIQLPAGKTRFVWIGPVTALSTANFSWWTAAYVNGLYLISASRLGYVASVPGSAYPGFAQLTPADNGSLGHIYEIDLKQSITLDSSQVLLIAPPAYTLRLVLASGLNTAELTLATADAGSYTSYTLSGADSATLSRAGSALALPTANAPLTLTAGDVLDVAVVNHAAGPAVLTLNY